MNRSFDYNGVKISPSKPVAKLTTKKRVVHLDSGDRDILQYPTNGDMVLYLPRVYEKVVGVKVKSAEFPAINNFFTHVGVAGNIFSADVALTFTRLQSIFLDIENLNRNDETALGHQGSSFTDGNFAKFQLPVLVERLLYNESSSVHNESHYQPAIPKLDRLHMTLRTHAQKGTGAYIYSSGGNTATSFEYSITLEIETMENSFDDYSSLETMVGDRAGSGYWNS